jgi:hypothetical protein
VPDQVAPAYRDLRLVRPAARVHTEHMPDFVISPVAVPSLNGAFRRVFDRR